MANEEIEAGIRESKGFRKDLDEVLQRLKKAARKSRERSLAMTKLQEAIMWLGMDLKEMHGGVSCYREGNNPESAEVEPTADGLDI